MTDKDYMRIITVLINDLVHLQLWVCLLQEALEKQGVLKPTLVDQRLDRLWRTDHAQLVDRYWDRVCEVHTKQGKPKKRKSSG